MTHHPSRKLGRLLWLLLCCAAAAAPGRAQALYEQCAALGDSGGEEVTRRLAALKAADPRARAEAAAALGRGCDRRAVGPLVALLGDEDPEARVAAVEALGRLGDREAIEPLIAALADKDWRVRRALAPALCSFQAHPASYAVLNTLVNTGDNPVKDEGDMRARCAGVIAIHQLRDVSFSRKALVFLFDFTADERPTLRQAAEAAALELKETRNGSHELIALLKQSLNPALRRQAAYWLGRLGMQSGRPALGEASVGDRDERVRQAAAEALAALKKSGH